ncbi:3-isopropylmalate dehydratase large subunit [Bradyrhizobium sp. Ai1a-2]|uniref:3-isopropylmalate dehydratase large subunit n=1 Tax=Bradyrhizobium sp. Ai1a-2 TaxID=196490 RepID=UPI0003FD9B69|nr:3-isopropylmalate dehydratase large subunit [Bradyrhizobium sp. Ai1a-2]
MTKTLLDKLWDLHIVADLGEGWSLLHIDRHLLHDLSGTAGLFALAQRGLAVANPELAFATPDHVVSTVPGRTGTTFEAGAKLWAGLKELSQKTGIRYFELGELGQGIVHVMAPELGITLPGVSLVCGDSHTCTNGGLGALAFGIGSSELTHALATQTLRQRKPKAMRVRFEGRLGNGIAPKDVILHLIGKIGASAGTGYAIEYAGEAIRAMTVEGRMTICNLSIELGSKIGFVAPDETTFKYVQGRRFAPKGDAFERALSHWHTLQAHNEAQYDRDEVIRAEKIAPTITWGTSPEHSIAIDEVVPDPSAITDLAGRKAWQEALEYMALTPGRPLAGTKVDWVFVGSCTNSRLTDLRDAAAIARGRRVVDGVNAWVVPGSEKVKREAEAEGLDAIFKSAGFEWREPGCSMCVAANGERVPPGARCVSTSNRNFVGRQGPGARTHLASPAMAVAAAVTGAITDVRRL